MTVKLDLKNKLINGCFEYWQRATSFLTIANGTYFADRWLYGKSGTMVHSALRSTDVQADSFGQYSAHLDVTTAQGVIGAGEYCYIGQKIEGNVLRSFKGKKIVLSFWVKATKVGTYCVAIRGASSSRSYIAEYSVSVTNTWEKKTIRLQHDTTGAWLYNTGVGIELDFILACGSSFQTAPNTWITGNFLGTANQVNAVDNALNDFRISDVILAEDNEGQSRLPDFQLAGRDLAEELLLCQRYYEKSYSLDVSPGTNITHGAITTLSSVTTMDINGFFIVNKRVTPSTLTVRSTATGATGNARDVNAGVDRLASVTALSDKSFRVINGIAYVSGNRMAFQWEADAEL
ncbi:hypothetical protein MASR1M48_16310 [Lactococcus petauri]